MSFVSEYLPRVVALTALTLSLVIGPAEMLAADSSSASSEILTVQIAENVEVTHRSVLLEDIGTIRCRNPHDRLKASQLDIGEFDDPALPLLISAEFVRIRLILAGWSADELDITGAAKATVRYREAKPLTDAEIEDAALKTLAAANEVSSDQLQVRLAQRFMPTLPPGIRDRDGLRVDVLPPTINTLGQITLTVRLWHDEEIISSRPARFEVFRRFRVAVTRVSLQRDQPLTSGTVQFEDRFLSRPADEPTDDMLIGRFVRSEVKAGTILSVRDLRDPQQLKPAIVIRRRDNVRVVARSGRIQVTLQTAEAQQDGRPGDLIRLKNLQTGQIISGQVMAAGYVEINTQ